MVNLVDTFTRLFGRAPTEAELGSIMRMKADQEAAQNKKLRSKENLMEKSLACQLRAKEARSRCGRKPSPQGISLPIRAYTINKLLIYQLTPFQIADAMDLNINYVDKAIEDYKLPRENYRRKLR